MTRLLDASAIVAWFALSIAWIDVLERRHRRRVTQRRSLELCLDFRALALLAAEPADGEALDCGHYDALWERYG